MAALNLILAVIGVCYIIDGVDYSLFTLTLNATAGIFMLFQGISA
jgi:hypothetical protein